MVDIPTLERTYKALSKRYYRVKNQIEQVDKQINCCDRLKKIYLVDYRKSLVDKLDGLDIAMNIVFKAIEQKEFY